MAEYNSADEQWLILNYRPTSLFSLRMTHATSKGGRTLLVPTPYAVKLALIDACFRCFAGNEAYQRSRQVYEWIKGMEIRFRPPAHCVVQNTFVKIKQQERNAPAGIYSPTIAYREFCYFNGDLEIALNVTGIEDTAIQILSTVATHITYLGKRGSFMQFISARTFNGLLPQGYTCPEDKADIANGSYGTTHYLDDFGEELIKEAGGFERINSFSQKSSTLGKYRVLTRTLIPYRPVSSGKHYTYYKRLPANNHPTIGS